MSSELKVAFKAGFEKEAQANEAITAGTGAISPLVSGIYTGATQPKGKDGWGPGLATTALGAVGAGLGAGAGIPGAMAGGAVGSYAGGALTDAYGQKPQGQKPRQQKPQGENANKNNQETSDEEDVEKESQLTSAIGGVIQGNKATEDQSGVGRGLAGFGGGLAGEAGAGVGLAASGLSPRQLRNPALMLPAAVVGGAAGSALGGAGYDAIAGT